MVLWLFLDIFPTLVLLTVWISIYAGHNSIRGISLASLAQYYLLIALFNSLTEVHFERQRVQEIREGKIDYFLTRPLPYLLEIVIGVIGNKLSYILFTLPFTLLLWLVVSQFMPIAPFSLSASQIGVGLVMLLMAFFLQLLMGITIVLLGFWFEGSEGLEHFKWLFTSVLGGTLAPLALLPGWLQSVINTLPFQYVYVVPVSLWQGTRQLQMSDIVYLLIVLTLGVAGVWTLWRSAVHRYSSAGG